MRPFVSGLAVASVAWAAAGSPALACGTCACSVNMSEVGSLGGGSNLYQRSNRFLLQQDVSYRSVNGTFNDQGTLRDIPLGTSIQALQATFGLAYFATPELLVGLQAPVLGNLYRGATPGSFGTVGLLEADSRGAFLGDVSLQAAYRLLAGNGPWPALGVWAGTLAPTGRSAGVDAEITGAGIWNATLGGTATGESGPWSYEGSLGYQRPLGTPSGQATNYFIGDAVVFQATGGYQLTESWKLGLGLNGYRGQSPQSTGGAISMSNVKLVPSVTYSLTRDMSLRLGVGFTPGYVARNALSDLSAYCTFYQYLN